MKYYLGIDIGGTKCAVILGSMSEGIIAFHDRLCFLTEMSKGPEYSLNKIFENIEKIMSNNNICADNIIRAGISCGGPLDSKRGIIMSPPNLIGWDNVHIIELIKNRFGISAKLQNDANACALAEWMFGAGRNCNNVVFLTFGTGLGAGLILDGRLYSGTNDMAGEIGHIRLENIGPVGYGKSGSFEGFCSGSGIAQIARIKVMEKLQKGEKVSFCESIDKLETLDAKSVGNAAEGGDELAREIYRISGHYLGKGLSTIIDLLNPEVIVIGSIFARSRDLLWDEAYKVIQSECLSHSLKVCKVVPAFLGNDIGDYAALSIAINE